MLRLLDRLRPAERPDAWIGFATLLAAMAGYTMLETARDALFLASIPATRLPFAYLAVAALAFAVTTALDRFGAAHRQGVVAGWLLLSALVTAGFYPFVRRGDAWSLYALYAWGGVLTTVVLVQFWGLLAARFTVVQAKRVYPFIGAGSVAGALLGTGLAGLLTTALPVRHLLLVAAGFLAVASFLPLLIRGDDAALDASASTASGQRPGRRADHRPAQSPATEILVHPYARHVLLLVVVSTVTLTFVDYVFKATVAEVVPPRELGSFFARVYFALNVLSLLAQLVFVRATIRTLTVTGALALLPILLVLGAVTAPFIGVLAAGLLMKGADGTLRYSLHRTATELLYVPMAPRLRIAAKNVGDVLGQRGGQALASLLILGSLALGLHELAEELAIVVLAVASAWVALRLRGPYLDLFRMTLREEARRSYLGFPELDQGSLEAILVALNSTNDREVRAAVDVLAAQGKAHVIPALILYHPSEDVVVDALEVLSTRARFDILPITDRLLESASPRLRAAALCARVRLGAGAHFLSRFVREEAPEVRATALVGLVTAAPGPGGVLDPAEALAELDDLLRRGDDAARVAIADAIAHRPLLDDRSADAFHELVLELASSPSRSVQLAALRAIAASPHPRYVSRLVSMLDVRELRPTARGALLAIGKPAFDALVAALDDPAAPVAIRRHVPRTLMRFEPEDAAPALLARVEAESDRVVRHKILRALTHLRDREPALALDPRALERLLLASVERALELRDRRTLLVVGGEAEPAVRTRYHALLVRLLRDLEVASLDQTFQLLALLRPDEDVGAIQRGLRSRRREVRAGSTELLASLLEGPVRDAFVGLVEDLDDRAVLRSAASLRVPSELDYAGVVRSLLVDRSEALRGLAVYQAGVLGLTDLLPEIRALEHVRSSLVAEAVRRVSAELLGARQVSPGAE